MTRINISKLLAYIQTDLPEARATAATSVICITSQHQSQLKLNTQDAGIGQLNITMNQFYPSYYKYYAIHTYCLRYLLF